MIGVFDSGMGGLSVLLEIRRLLPGADLVYLADQDNAPYGDRTLDDVRRLAEPCTSHLLALGADIVVVACNTASAAALHHLRALHPGVLFVGMEPAIKPAAAVTRGGVIGVLATAATFQGELFSSLMGRFGGNVQIVAKVCRGWADLVERAELTGPRAEGLIADHLDPRASRRSRYACPRLHPLSVFALADLRSSRTPGGDNRPGASSCQAGGGNSRRPVGQRPDGQA